MENQAVSTMTKYPMQSDYPDTEPTSPCHILIMSSAWLGSDEYQFSSHWFDSTRVQTPPDLPKRESDTKRIRPSRLVPQPQRGHTWYRLCHIVRLVPPRLLCNTKRQQRRETCASPFLLQSPLFAVPQIRRPTPLTSQATANLSWLGGGGH